MVIRFFFSEVSIIIFFKHSIKASTEFGEKPKAASPYTSGKLLALLEITGHPQLMASKIGRPNPSYLEVQIYAVAPLYKLKRRS